MIKPLRISSNKVCFEQSCFVLKVHRPWGRRGNEAFSPPGPVSHRPFAYPMPWLLPHQNYLAKLLHWALKQQLFLILYPISFVLCLETEHAENPSQPAQPPRFNKSVARMYSSFGSSLRFHPSPLPDIAGMTLEPGAMRCAGAIPKRNLQESSQLADRVGHPILVVVK